MAFGLSLVTPPAGEPVSLAQAKLQCRVDHAEEDELIGGVYVPAARRFVEDWTDRALITQTWRVTFDAFHSPLILPKGRVQSVTGVSYFNAAGADTTLAASDYMARLAAEPARLWPAVEWPELWADGHGDLVSVTFAAGYGDHPEDVPAPIKLAVLMLTAHFYANREPVLVGVSGAQLEFSVKALLSPYWVGDYARLEVA